MLADLHMHSEYSPDAKPDATIRSICCAAISRGFSTIALTDHQDFQQVKPYVPLDVAAMQRDIRDCQQEFEGQLTVLAGVEIGEIHLGGYAEDFFSTYAFDQVIGSTHNMPPDDADIYDLPFHEMDCEAFLHVYFDQIERMVRHGGFDVLGHIDYPLRVMSERRNTLRGFEDRLEPIFRMLIDREIALEINGAALFGQLKRPGPEPFVLELYRSLGGTMLTVGSDSHCAPDAGRGVAECITYAKNAGFRELTIFKNRKPQQMAL